MDISLRVFLNLLIKRNCFQEWNNLDRLQALDRLIAVCEPAQVRHMMNVIEPQFQRDFISLLPKEVSSLRCHVLSFIAIFTSCLICLFNLCFKNKRCLKIYASCHRLCKIVLF